MVQKQLDLLWEYQNLDLMIEKYEEKKKSLPLRRKLIKLKNYLIGQQNKLLKINSEIEKRNRTFRRIEHECDNIVHSLNAERKRVENGDIKSLKQLEQVQKKAFGLRRRINKKEERLAKLLNDLESFSKKLEDIRVNMLKAKKEYVTVKAEYDKEAKKIDDEYAKLKKKKDELAEKIDKALMAKYNSLKVNHRMAMAKIDQDRCGGCNMSLASLVIQKVKEKKGIVECENCGRILYTDES